MRQVHVQATATQTAAIASNVANEPRQSSQRTLADPISPNSPQYTPNRP